MNASKLHPQDHPDTDDRLTYYSKQRHSLSHLRQRASLPSTPLPSSERCGLARQYETPKRIQSPTSRSRPSSASSISGWPKVTRGLGSKALACPWKNNSPRASGPYCTSGRKSSPKGRAWTTCMRGRRRRLTTLLCRISGAPQGRERRVYTSVLQVMGCASVNSSQRFS